MARISVIQLAEFPATPSWAQSTLTEAQVYAEQITGATGRAEEMAWATGSAAQAGWAEVQRQILALPAVGLPECIPGLTSELQDLAKGSWGIGQLQASRAWLKTSGMGPAIGDILASVQAGNGKFPAAFSDYSTKAIGKAIEVVVGDVQGWTPGAEFVHIDPARRDQATGRRRWRLEDLEPGPDELRGCAYCT